MLLYSIKDFTATQKGQVSVSRNSEIELISDKHWYWWFVKVTLSGVEGFVPADLLERPSERLARLNSQLNVKMSTEPLKLDCRRFKKRKTVRFSTILFSTDQDELSVPDLYNNTSPQSSDDSDSDIVSSPEIISVLHEVWTDKSLKKLTPLKEQNAIDEHSRKSRVMVQAL